MTKEMLENIEQLAYRLFLPRQIAIIMDISDVEDFEAKCAVLGNPCARAYWKGRFQQMNELRENIIKAAKNGSNPAQEQLLALLKDSTNEIVI